MSITNHAVLEGQEVPCWLLKIDLSWWKNAEEGQRDGSIRESLNILNGRMKGLGLSGDVG